MFTLTAWRTSASWRKEEPDMERMSLKRAAIFGVLALGVAFGGALAPVSSPAEAAEAAVRGGPICAAAPCPPPEDHRSGGPICAATPCPPPPDERAPRGDVAGKPNCVAAPCPPPTDQ